MPKLKTKRGAAKRFKITKTGKVKSKRAGKGHLLTGRSRKRKRHLSKIMVLKKAQARNIKELLPYA
jgi:large subunit ribosomal protein L35